MEWLIIASASSSATAHIWRSRLEAAGISAQVVPKSYYTFGVLAASAIDPGQHFDVYVPLTEAPDALVLLESNPSPTSA
jgi:hypothetical protein